MGMDCFFCCFFGSRKDHVKFNLVYSASSNKAKFIMSIISCLAIILILGWALFPTIDYIDWMKIRKTSTVRFPFTGEKIKLSYIFSIYGIFMISLIGFYIWKLKNLINVGPEDDDKNKLRSVVKY